MEEFEWFALCVFEGSRQELLSQSINIQDILYNKIDSGDREILDSIYDCYCKWWEATAKNDGKSITFSQIFKTNLCRIDTHIAISRLKIMEDTINFEEVDNNTIRVWVGIQIDDYLYGLLSHTNINTEEKTEPQSPFVPNNN